MQTDQPVWELIANLGDINPIDHGGYLIYRDTTGRYAEEAEMLISPDDDGGPWLVYRFSLDRCTYRSGVLSDNKFYPRSCAWFAERESERKNRPQDSTYLSNIAKFIGASLTELRAQFCSNNPLDRARAYRAIGEYHGFDNLDNYPLQFKSRAEIEAHYA